MTITMDAEMREKLDRLLEKGEIDREMYDEMMKRWSEGTGEGEEEKARDTDEKKEPGDKGDVIKISGYGKLADAKAHQLLISGSGRISGEVEVDIFDASGSATVDGRIRVRDRMSVSGSLKAGSSIEGGTIAISGGVTGKSIRCRVLATSGGMDISGDIEAETLRLTGRVSAERISADLLEGMGTAKAGSIRGGRIKIRGAINADEVRATDFMLESMGWSTRIGSIEAETVVISSRRRLRLTGGVPEIKEIKGERVEIENARCGRIVAGEAIIGDNCEVGYVEAKKISVSRKSSVKEKKVVG